MSSSVLPLTPAQLGHRDHIPLVIPPWHREGKLISQGPGVTDLELAFSELRLRKVQLVLPAGARGVRAQSNLAGKGGRRHCCGAEEEPCEPCASPGSCWLPILCNPASMGSLHPPPAAGTGSRAWNTPSCPLQHPQRVPRAQGLAAPSSAPLPAPQQGEGIA